VQPIDLPCYNAGALMVGNARWNQLSAAGQQAFQDKMKTVYGQLG
jgi:hypothetical protein